MNRTKKVVRKHIIFYGRVQGVGFRYTAYCHANELGLTGWVQNQRDGTVKMEVQGKSAQINRLLTMLNSGRYISISDIDIKEIPVLDSEHGFQIQ